MLSYYYPFAINFIKARNDFYGEVLVIKQPWFKSRMIDSSFFNHGY